MAKTPKPTKKTADKVKTKPKAVGKKSKPVDDDIHPAARPFLWLGSNWVQRGFMWVIGLLMLISIAMNFIKKPYGHFAWQEAIGGYAIFGFLAFTFIVLMGGPLRKLTGRKDDYYEDGEPDD